MKEKILTNVRIIDPSQTMDEIGNIVIDQKGNILVAEGKVADDGMLLGMNVYVKGVEGDIPK